MEENEEININEITVKVFDEASRRSFDGIDIVCPSCFTVVASPYKGKVSSISKKCPGCKDFVTEYTAIAVEHDYGHLVKSSSQFQRRVDRLLREFYNRFFQLHEIKMNRDQCKEDAKKHGYDIESIVDDEFLDIESK